MQDSSTPTLTHEKRQAAVGVPVKITLPGTGRYAPLWQASFNRKKLAEGPRSSLLINIPFFRRVAREALTFTPIDSGVTRLSFRCATENGTKIHHVELTVNHATP